MKILFAYFPPHKYTWLLGVNTLCILYFYMNEIPGSVCSSRAKNKKINDTFIKVY